jgi:hypothetical protein
MERAVRLVRCCENAENCEIYARVRELTHNVMLSLSKHEPTCLTLRQAQGDIGVRVTSGFG